MLPILLRLNCTQEDTMQDNLQRQTLQTISLVLLSQYCTVHIYSFYTHEIKRTNFIQSNHLSTKYIYIKSTTVYVP
jgi:hypothetical protein